MFPDESDEPQEAQSALNDLERIGTARQDPAASNGARAPSGEHSPACRFPASIARRTADGVSLSRWSHFARIRPGGAEVGELRWNHTPRCGSDRFEGVRAGRLEPDRRACAPDGTGRSAGAGLPSSRRSRFADAGAEVLGRRRPAEALAGGGCVGRDGRGAAVRGGPAVRRLDGQRLSRHLGVVRIRALTTRVVSDADVCFDETCCIYACLPGARGVGGHPWHQEAPWRARAGGGRDTCWLSAPRRRRIVVGLGSWRLRSVVSGDDARVLADDSGRGGGACAGSGLHRRLERPEAGGASLNCVKPKPSETPVCGRYGMSGGSAGPAVIRDGRDPACEALMRAKAPVCGMRTHSSLFAGFRVWFRQGAPYSDIDVRS